MGAVLTFVSIFSFTVGVKRINAKNHNFDSVTYKGVLSLWQVDMFEGGRGSRRQFLLDTAVGFEKKNSGVLVMVTNYTKDGVEENFKKGIYPDLISFSNGLNVDRPVQTSQKTDVVGGKIGDKTYFVPWCRGGYVLISNPRLSNVQDEVPLVLENLLVSQGAFTQPLIALLEHGIRVEKLEVLGNMEAYIKFTSGMVKHFLGTQRDVCRLINRGMEFSALPLDGFNDLYQYIGITCTDIERVNAAESFVEYLISEKVQKKLNKISMLSPYFSVDFDDNELFQMQSVTNFKTISAFTNPKELLLLQQLSKTAVTGDKDSQIKIKNVLI